MVCLRGCIDTLCGGCGSYGSYDAYTVVCVGCEHVERVREGEGDSKAGVGDGGCVIAVNAGHKYLGGTCGSGNVSSADYVIEMSVVRG